MNITPTTAPDERLDYINERLVLIQKKNGLTYGTDAFLLSAFVRSQRHARAVDLGSGTGVIPLLLCAGEKVQIVYACELQPAFVELIHRNAAANGMEGRIIPLLSDVRTLRPHDPVINESGCEAFDVVTANPPYMAVGAGARNHADEKYMARHEVAGGVDDFCACAARLLRSGGSFYCVYRPDRLSLLMQALAGHRLEPKRMAFVHADEDSEPSVVLIEARLDGAPGCKLLPPLLLHQTSTRTLPHRPLTPRAQRIYDTLHWGDTEERSRV